MFEQFRSFADYVKDYELQRSEGLLLRHLSSVHKILCQTVPDGAKDDAVREMELYLGMMIRQVDSSLLDEWEKMREPGLEPKAEGAKQRPGEAEEVRLGGAEADARDITRDAKAFLAAIRNRIFTFLRGLVIGDHDQALAALSAPEDSEGRAWTTERLQEALAAYHAEHELICLDPNARNLRHTHVVQSLEEGTMVVQQVLVDPGELCNWVAEFEIDLEQSKARREPVLRLRRVGPMA
jgi:hypothetical protein